MEYQNVEDATGALAEIEDAVYEAKKKVEEIESQRGAIEEALKDIREELENKDGRIAELEAEVEELKEQVARYVLELSDARGEGATAEAAG